MADEQPPRIELAVHRTVKVLGIDSKSHALEMTNVNGEVQVTPLPRNNGRRQPVRLDDLATAVAQLGGEG